MPKKLNFKKGGELEEKEIGRVTHYYTHLGVAIVELDKDSLKVGETVHIKGHTSDFTQKVESMQIEHESVEEAKAGDAIGLKIKEHAREKDAVYKVTE